VAIPGKPLLILLGTSLALLPQGGTAAELGTFRLTTYHLAIEGGAAGQTPGDWPLFGPGCRRVLALAPRAFHHALSREGSGLLRDGRLLNFLERCPCARPGHAGSRICYIELARSAFPWGRGARLGEGFAPLRPFRSVAVDPAVIPLGTVLYVPALRGLRAPDGALLDGCLRAEDTGLAVRGHHLDLFTGLEVWARWLHDALPTRRVTVRKGDGSCRG
jgi:3D (Asp-Asp-Asp) domain-containing protein